MCFLTIPVFSLVKYLFKSLPVFYVSLPFDCRAPSLRYIFANISSQSVAYLLIPLTLLYDEQSFLVLIRSNLFSLLLFYDNCFPCLF